MSRQYFQRAKSPWNSTDQRLQEIMKKYEHSHQPLNKTQKRRPLENYEMNRMDDSQRSFAKSPWKGGYYEGKTQDPPEYRRKEKQNKLFDSIFFKENHEIQRESQKIDYKRTQKDYNRKYSKQEYKFQKNEPSFYDEKFTFSQQSFANIEQKRRQNELLQAKKYLQEQERKYLKTQVYENSENRRQRRQEKQKIIPKRNDKAYRIDYERNQEKIDVRSYKKKDYEPRISNIEKINNKIKQILNLNKTFTVEATREDLPSERFNKTSYKSQYVGQNKNNRKLLSRTPQKINGRNAAKPNKGQEDNLGRENKIEERSKSCLNLKKKVQIQAEPSKYSQKAEQHIAKFNNKISQFAQQKKKLNISFKNYEHKEQNSAITVYEPLNESFGREFNKKIDKLATHVKCKTQHIDDQDFSKEYDGDLQSPYIGLKELESYDQSMTAEIQSQSNREYSFFKKKKQYKNNEEMQQKINKQSKKLLQMLTEQVQLDSKFRQTKNWFNNSTQNSSLTLLQQLLCRKWREMSIEEVQHEFSINFQEEDPFYSYRPEQFEIQDLVANYIICNKHWSEKIEGQWDINKLMQQNFFEKVDLEGKGFLQIQDLVREINMNEGVFFRNRDLYLIFQRFEVDQSERLSQQQLSSVLGKK